MTTFLDVLPVDFKHRAEQQVVVAVEQLRMTCTSYTQSSWLPRLSDTFAQNSRPLWWSS
jgi:hypothetical protein